MKGLCNCDVWRRCFIAVNASLSPEKKRISFYSHQNHFCDDISYKIWKKLQDLNYLTKIYDAYNSFLILFFILVIANYTFSVIVCTYNNFYNRNYACYIKFTI